MSCFDNSQVCYPRDSSPATYHSYMCRSGGSQGTERLLNTVDYDQLWSVSQEECAPHSKPHYISKLRNILSETITHITKDSKLQKGESVELTLEIQLMKTANNTPSNSMVEVTIIQHNKKKRNENNIVYPASDIKQTKITNSETSESASQKRRNWFQRVISWQNDKDWNDNDTKRKQNATPFTRKTENTGFYFDEKSIGDDNRNSNNKHPRSNFVRILPERIPKGGNFVQGYRRVSPKKKTPRVTGNLQNTGHEKTIVTKKQSLVSKLSEIFLPHKKSYKSKAVNTPLTALKNEVDSTHNQTIHKNEERRKRNKALLGNLGKQVGNSSDNKMDLSNSANRNETINNPLSLKYQDFFERVSKTKINKRKEKKQPEKPTNLTNTKLAQSHSDTCCVHFKCDSSELKVRASNSVSNFRILRNSNNQLKSLDKGDSTERTSEIKNTNKNKTHKKTQKKHAKGDAANQPDFKVSRKRLHRSDKKICAKKSLIEWNGQTVEVDKYVKTKIEMLIVNELNNLALKEGMECDVIPLHYSEQSSEKPVEKISSFFCELDISDKKVKHYKNKKSSETKTVSNQISSKGLKKNLSTSKLKQKHKIKKNKESKTRTANLMKKETQMICLDETVKKQPSTKSGLTKGTTNKKILSTEQADYNDDVKITYVNMNTKNWSAESTTLKFRSPGTGDLTEQQSKAECKTSVFKFGEGNSTYQKAISSGFIKIIDSNDSAWKNYHSKTKNFIVSDRKFSKQLVSLTNTKSSMKFSSSTSNEYQSSIEIELDIKDLEAILNEAKQKQRADKVLINAKCKKERKKQKPIRFTGKNSSSYTNQLLTNAAEKLEQFAKRKKK